MLHCRAIVKVILACRERANRVTGSCNPPQHDAAEVRLIFIQARDRAHKADEIAGSKFEIFCRHFSSLWPRPLAFLFSSLLHTVLLASHTRFNWDGCQGNRGTGVSRGLLKRLKGTAIPFATSTLENPMTGSPCSWPNYENRLKTLSRQIWRFHFVSRLLVQSFKTIIKYPFGFLAPRGKIFEREKGIHRTRWKSISQGLHGSIILLNSRFAAIVRGGLLVPAKKRAEFFFFFVPPWNGSCEIDNSHHLAK